jgi:hypothetical protein
VLLLGFGFGFGFGFGLAFAFPLPLGFAFADGLTFGFFAPVACPLPLPTVPPAAPDDVSGTKSVAPVAHVESFAIAAATTPADSFGTQPSW